MPRLTPLTQTSHHHLCAQAAEELVANIRTVRTFAQEGREKVTFASRVEESYLRAKEVCRAWGQGRV